MLSSSIRGKTLRESSATLYPARPNSSIVDCCMLPLGRPSRSVDSGSLSVIGDQSRRWAMPTLRLGFLLRRLPFVVCDLAHRVEKLVALVILEMMLDELLCVFEARAFLDHILI